MSQFNSEEPPCTALLLFQSCCPSLSPPPPRRKKTPNPGRRSVPAIRNPQSTIRNLLFPAHPRLLFNHEGIEHFKQKITQEPWRAQWAAELASLGKGLTKTAELPPRGGNWSHNYVCPEHGARLKAGKKIGEWQWEHKCPVGPHMLHGDPSKASLDFDGNMIADAHGKNAARLRDLGLAWQVTGNQRYAEAARALLLAYAGRYLTYPLHNNQGKAVKKQGAGGRIASQSLTEASWLIPMVQGADLIWDTLSETDREHRGKETFPSPRFRRRS